MATLQADDVLDLVKTTLEELGRFRYTDIASDLQKHVAWNQMMTTRRSTFSSGTSLKWDVMVSTSTAAKNTGLFEVDDVDVPDVMQTADVEWRHNTFNMAIERRTVRMNASPAKVVDLVGVRRTTAFKSGAELFETNAWTNPADSTDALKPFGFPYWIVYNATEGFNGSNPSGYSAGAGGLNSDTFTRWKNWSANFAAISKDDFVKKLRKAATFTHFEASARSKPKTFNTGDDYGYYCTYAILSGLEELLEAQNQNLGFSIDSMDGRTLFRSAPVIWAPILENKDSEVLYGINWGVFELAFLSGEFLHQTGPRISPQAHTVIDTHWDSTMNFRCYDRRRNFVIADGDPGEDV